MCVVSAVIDYGRRIPTEQWDLGRITEYQELVRKARKFDEMSKQPDCEDKEKAKLLRKLELLEAKIKVQNELGELEDKVDAAKSDLLVIDTELAAIDAELKKL